MLERLLPLLADFEQGGFAVWRERWQSLDAYRDQAVLLTSGSEQKAGIARGVDEHGALIVESDAGVISAYGGELSLRGAH
jgi:BirA family biotin operon repressor/biotin-[acetyl-CoA-carboxylase] ligase